MKEKLLAEILNEKKSEAIANLDNGLNEANEIENKITEIDYRLGEKANKLLSDMPAKNRIMVPEEHDNGSGYHYTHYSTLNKNGFGSAYDNSSHTSYYTKVSNIIESEAMNDLPEVIKGIKKSKHDQFNDVTGLLAKYKGKIYGDETDLQSLELLSVNPDLVETNWYKNKIVNEKDTDASVVTIAVQIRSNNILAKFANEEEKAEIFKEKQVTHYRNDLSYDANSDNQWEEYAFLEQMMPKIKDMIAKRIVRLNSILKEFENLEKELGEFSYYLTAKEL
jgi:hypothetical protein